MPVTQDNRLIAIATPLGKDYLLLNKFSAREGLSQLFSIEAELLHEENEAAFNPTVVDPKSLLGSGVTISVAAPDGTVRDYSGIVIRFTQGNRDVRFSYYNATIVPRVWLLTQRIQSQIFQQESVPEILKTMFEGFEVRYELQRTYEPRNYCVQYRESDFDFASRLMEEEGMFYFFSHADGVDKLVIADTPQSHPDCPSKSEIPFFVKVGEQEDFIGSINGFLSGYCLQTGKVTLWDNNFQLPGKNLERQETSIFTYGENKKLEHYDFPAGYARKYDGINNGGGEQNGELQKVFNDRDATGKHWMEGLDAEVETATGRGDCCSITSGHKFTLKNHPNSSLNSAYVITSVQHYAEQNPSYSTNESANEPYTNEFKCIAFGAGKPCFRPPRVTRKPTINGSQTAMVVGPPGEEIFTDKFGRVKVQFHWDRDGKYDAVSSCWVRVAQSWAGNKWGGMFIPRVGMEVLVHFLEGDPDQPIITGCVYNPDSMPAYTLPDQKTKSGIKSNSYGSRGFNELRFEDKAGKEQIFIHAQKDQDIRVLNDCKELIKHDRHLIIENEQFEEVKKDKHLTIKGDHNEKIGGSMSINVTSDIDEKAGMNYALDAGQAVHIKAGMSAVIEAGASLTLKVGGNFINLNSGGVFISGTMVMLNSGGAAGSGAGSSPEAPKPPTEADNAEPGNKPKPPSPAPRAKVNLRSPMAVVLQRAAKDGTPFCAICEQIRKERAQQQQQQQSH